MKTVELPFGKFEFYPELIIGKLNYGIHFDFQKNEELVKVVKNHYGYDLPLSYIGMRDNNYSIDPMVHKHNSQYENLCSITIVASRESLFSTIELESNFFKSGKLLSFSNVEEALVWSNKEVTNKFDDLNSTFSLN